MNNRAQTKPTYIKRPALQGKETKERKRKTLREAIKLCS